MKIEKIVLEQVEAIIEEVTLLPVEVAKKLDKDILKVGKEWTDWWLQSQYEDWCVATVDGNGNITANYQEEAKFVSVRPALRIANLDSLNASELRLAGHDWVVVPDGYALCRDVVGTCAFREEAWDEDANVYEESDIKIWLENWAKKKGIGATK